MSERYLTLPPTAKHDHQHQRQRDGSTGAPLSNEPGGIQQPSQFQACLSHLQVATVAIEHLPQRTHPFKRQLPCLLPACGQQATQCPDYGEHNPHRQPQLQAPPYRVRSCFPLLGWNSGSASSCRAAFSFSTVISRPPSSKYVMWRTENVAFARSASIVRDSRLSDPPDVLSRATPDPAPAAEA